MVTTLTIEGTLKAVHVMKHALFQAVQSQFPGVPSPTQEMLESTEPFTACKLVHTEPSTMGSESSGTASRTIDILPGESASNAGSGLKSDLLSWMGHIAHTLNKMNKSIVNLR